MNSGSLNSQSPLISCKKLSIKIADKQLIKNLDWNIYPDSSWAVLGKNGAGKTHLLHTIAGLYQNYTGDINLDRAAIKSYTDKQRAQRIGLLLQNTQYTFPGTVLEYVLIGRHPHTNNWRGETTEDIEYALQAIRKVELDGFENRDIHTLSGGEIRRMEIACLLCQQIDVMILDEPVNHLDWHQQHRTLDFLTTQQGKAIVMALHDANLAARYCDNCILLLEDGLVKHGSCEEILTEENLSELYQHKVKIINTDGERIFIPS